MRTSLRRDSMEQVEKKRKGTGASFHLHGAVSVTGAQPAHPSRCAGPMSSTAPSPCGRQTTYKCCIISYPATRMVPCSPLLPHPGRSVDIPDPQINIRSGQEDSRAWGIVGPCSCIPGVSVSQHTNKGIRKEGRSSEKHLHPFQHVPPHRESRLTSLGHYQISVVSEESLLFSPVGPERVQKERRDQGSPQSGTHHAMKLFSPPPHGSCYLENVRNSLCGVSVAPASPAGPKAVKGMSGTHLPML